MLKQTSFPEKLSGTIEVDETYVGGNLFLKPKARCFISNKTPVVSLLQRGGPVRSQVMPSVNGQNLKNRPSVITCLICSEIHTDMKTAVTWDCEPK